MIFEDPIAAGPDPLTRQICYGIAALLILSGIGVLFTSIRKLTRYLLWWVLTFLALVLLALSTRS
jgi:hypothetical protein